MLSSFYITTTVLITAVTIAILNANPQKVHGTQENRLTIFILNPIKYTFNLQKRHSIQDNTFTVFAFSPHHTCFFLNCGMLPFILVSYLIYLQHHICPQSSPPAPNEDSVHYSVQASSVTLSSHLPLPTTQPPPPPLPAKNKDMHIYQNTNSTTFYAVSVF